MPDQEWYENLMKRVAPGRFIPKNGGCMSFGKGAVYQIFLEPPKAERGEQPGLYLKFWPGFNVQQARCLYKGLVPKQLLALNGKTGWFVKTRLHLSGAFCAVLTAEAQVPLARFLRYWKENRTLIRQYSKGEFGTVLASLCRDGLFSPEDRTNYKKKFIESNISVVRLCPGLIISFYWSPREVEKLERENGLVGAARERIQETFDTWRQPVSFEKEKDSAPTAPAGRSDSAPCITPLIRNVGPLIKHVVEIHEKKLTEKNMEDAVKDFLRLLGHPIGCIEFQRHVDGGFIDILLSDADGKPWAVLEVKKSLADKKIKIQARKQGFDYAGKVGARLVVLTDADRYEIYDRNNKGLEYEEQHCGSLRLTKWEASMDKALDLLRPPRD